MPYQVWTVAKDMQTNEGKKVYFTGVSPHLGVINLFAGTYKKGKNKGKKYILVTISKGNSLLSDKVQRRRFVQKLRKKRGSNESDYDDSPPETNYPEYEDMIGDDRNEEYYREEFNESDFL